MKKSEHLLADHESLINNVLRQALSADTPDLSLELLLDCLGKALQCDRVYIFEQNEDLTFDNTYEWCAPDVTPHKKDLQHVPYGVLSCWYERFCSNENVIITSMSENPFVNPAVHELLTYQNIQTLVVSPLTSQDHIIGFYGVDNPPSELMDHISAMFELLGHFITSIIRRRNLVRRLEALSFYDQLTGAKNRHAMNEFIAHVDRNKSIGLVYCDVMGLKKTNDTKGHLEGDAVLVRSCKCLQKHFPKEAVFRIGGDEFLMMQSDISEETLQEQVAALTNDMPDHGIMLAVGTAWSPCCNGHITDLMKLADTRMYEDKRNYYEKDGCDRRRSGSRSD